MHVMNIKMRIAMISIATSFLIVWRAEGFRINIPKSRPPRTVTSSTTHLRYKLDVNDELIGKDEHRTTQKNRASLSRILNLRGYGGASRGRATPTPSVRKGRKRPEKRVVRDVHELRGAVLRDGMSLKDLELSPSQSSPDGSAFSGSSGVNDSNGEELHPILELIRNRAETSSAPKSRDDPHRLALAIEGGGMRGAVSAGMAAAIASLGLSDSFDVIYGSSAGSVIGAYMVSRQMCMDVYTDILPAAKGTFVSKFRIVRSIVRTIFSSSSNTNRPLYREGTAQPPQQMPGMNISFVLDGILCPQNGLRPLDMEAFQNNDLIQPLKVASSTVQDNGKLESFCFGTNDFFGPSPTKRTDNARTGLFACLEASMTVPGATGPPVPLTRRTNDTATSFSAFDAFCFEPLPYMSAVEEGATHVLVLRSRPSECTLKTVPGVYETAVAPLYFKSHGFPQAADFFQRGGQQYIYAESLLNLEEGRRSRTGVSVPPPEIMYGLKEDDSAWKEDTGEWKRAHLLPVTVPGHKSELAVLQQDEDEVLEAVRGGFAAAFDLLAPVVPGLELEESMTGDRVAKLMFPVRNVTHMEGVMSKVVKVTGDKLEKKETAESIATISTYNLSLDLMALTNQELQSTSPYQIPKQSKQSNSANNVLFPTHPNSLNNDTSIQSTKRARARKWMQEKRAARKRRLKNLLTGSSKVVSLHGTERVTSNRESSPKRRGWLKRKKQISKQQDNLSATVHRPDPSFSPDKMAQGVNDLVNSLDPSQCDATKLLKCLPGFKAGKLIHLMNGLQWSSEISADVEEE